MDFFLLLDKSTAQAGTNILKIYQFYLLVKPSISTSYPCKVKFIKPLIKGHVQSIVHMCKTGDSQYKHSPNMAYFYVTYFLCNIFFRIEPLDYIHLQGQFLSTQMSLLTEGCPFNFLKFLKGQGKNSDL